MTHLDADLAANPAREDGGLLTEAPLGYGEIIAVLAAVPVILRETRRRKGESLRGAADQLGIAASTVMRWERHEQEPSTTDIIRILRWAAA
jgi:ribosome-binding protein aMBF1 (putative translation factor)